MTYFKAEDFDGCDMVCVFDQGAVAARANDRIQPLVEENALLRETLGLVLYLNKRGYPTPKEWDELVKVARAALEIK